MKEIWDYKLVFDQQPFSYATDKAGIAYLVSLLRGKALTWATALWDDQSPLLASYAAFAGEMRKVFNHQV